VKFPLLGAKQTSSMRASTTGNDPKRTSAAGCVIGPAAKERSVRILLPDQSFTLISVKRNPAGVLVKMKMSSPQKT
jgi:hypothetical protein